MTYTLIDSTTLASSASSVTFSSIDQSYGDLVLVVEYLADGTLTSPKPIFNSDSGNNYHYVLMSGNGSSTASYADTTTYVRSTYSAVATSSSAHLITYQIMDYSATDKHKTVLSRGNQTQTYPATEAFANRWANTAAITQIDVQDNGSTQFAAGSTFYLYGIEA